MTCGAPWVCGLRDLSLRVNAPSPTRPVPIPRTIFEDRAIFARARACALWARPRETSTRWNGVAGFRPSHPPDGVATLSVFERVYSLAGEAVAEVSTGRSECLLQSSQEPSKS